MEGLLPVIIALVVSAVIGMRKKKSETEPFPTEESPWDDLMRELQQAQEREPHEMSTKQEVPLPQPVEATSSQPDLASVLPEQPKVAAEMQSSYGPETVPAPSMAVPVQSAPVDRHFDFEVLHLQDEVRKKEAEEEGSGETVFGSGFDPRMAVLYSEVFRPKYLD